MLDRDASENDTHPRYAPAMTTTTARAGSRLLDLLDFGYKQALSCLFAVSIVVGLAITHFVDFGLARYDTMLVWCIVVQIVLLATKIETRDELLVICMFHVLGLALEVFKVAVGSWSYPDAGLLRIGDVPIYSGFMYAAIASYICQAWRRFDLDIDSVPMVPTMITAILFYVNFFTNHWLPDARWPLLIVVAVLMRKTWVRFRVRQTIYRMPLLVSFLLIGFFIWFVENIATILGAWSYPGQEAGWTLVHASKIGSWMVLVIFSFMLVLWFKQRKKSLVA
jgi:uncharacterized membrane protein YoaT (DUF817 family)